MLLLCDVWAMHDLELCSVCPDEIAEGELSISIIDNDDFLNDTLTGGGTAHRCNWMFLQRLERHFPLLRLRSSARVRLKWPCCH